MKISLAMTTFNGEKYVLKQLESIRAQTRKLDEVIICDDSSTDATYEVVCQYVKDNKLNWMVKKNNRNIGYIQNFYNTISLTTGDYVFLCDQDDIWLENKVEEIISIMKKNSINVINTSVSLIDGNGINLSKEHLTNKWIKYQSYFESEELKKIDFWTIFNHNIAPGCTMCFTKKVKEILVDVGTHKDFPHDWEINLIGSIIGSIFYINKELIKYRIHSNNTIGLSQKKDLKISYNSVYRDSKKLFDRVEFIRNKLLKYTNDFKIKNYIDSLYKLLDSRIAFLISKSWRSFVKCFKQELKNKKIRSILIDFFVLIRIIR